MSELEFGMNEGERKEFAKNLKLDSKTKIEKDRFRIQSHFKEYRDLSSQRKDNLHTKYRVMRRGLKRFEAIMTLAVAQNVTPEAISQVLREDYNNCA